MPRAAGGGPARAWSGTRGGAATHSSIADVDIGAHIDRTTGIDFDARKNRLVTASDDRSIRIWDATNGRLLRTIWVPRDERKDGELYALAVDPKTSTAVVGGWTGYDWDGSMSIYVVDLNTGKFRGRIQGFEERIASLAYSRDGKKLAVVLLNGHLLVLSVPDYKVQAENTCARARRIASTSVRGIDWSPIVSTAISVCTTRSST